LEHAENVSAALIFGGDGTVHRHLAPLHQQKIPMLVVPTGSGNDFAKALGIRSLEIALRTWQQFCADGKNVRDIHLGVIRANGQEKLFLLRSRSGNGRKGQCTRQSNADMAQKTRWIRTGSVASVDRFRAAEMTVTAEGTEFRRSAFFIAVGNALSYGGGMKVTPQATLDDGLLDICLVKQNEQAEAPLLGADDFFRQTPSA
jgi:diacylglycerol kinase (ATP)